MQNRYVIVHFLVENQSETGGRTECGSRDCRERVRSRTIRRRVGRTGLESPPKRANYNSGRPAGETAFGLADKADRLGMAEYGQVTRRSAPEGHFRPEARHSRPPWRQNIAALLWFGVAPHQGPSDVTGPSRH